MDRHETKFVQKGAERKMRVEISILGQIFSTSRMSNKASLHSVPLSRLPTKQNSEAAKDINKLKRKRPLSHTSRGVGRKQLLFVF